MRSRLTIPVLFLLVATGCVGERPVLSGEPIPTAAVSSEELAAEVTTTEAPADEPPTTLPVPGPVRALITPTGVVVPVTGEQDGRYDIITPCGEEGSLVWGTPIHTADVVLDPGHGGEVETGAVGPNGLAEKDLNLDVSKRTARLLEDRGFSVVLARTADYRVPLAVRAEIANNLDASLLVSIHHNAPNANPSETPGTEIFIQSGSSESARLGGILWEEVTTALSAFDIEWTTAEDAGALRVVRDDGEDSYGMVRRPLIPAVLAELGYLSNQPEAELFETDEYRDVAAGALADGIERFLTSDDAGSGFVDEPRNFTPTGGTGGSGGCVDPDLE